MVTGLLSPQWTLPPFLAPRAAGYRRSLHEGQVWKAWGSSRRQTFVRANSALPS